MQSGYEGYELTAAAERVLDEAAHWASACNGNELPPGALLLGLLAESECRAAQWLRTRAIDRGDVLAHFPGLERLGVATASASRSPAWLRPLLRAADSLFATQPRPTTVATEHLLLGLLTANRDMAEWIDSTGEAIRELAAEMSQRL
ncbi:MAG: Clp protease N-terminal domain-containing protein, partial [Pirellulales bacterium]